MALACVGCTSMPSGGPSASSIQGTESQAGTRSIQVVEIDDRVTGQLQARHHRKTFDESLGQTAGPPLKIGRGDALEIDIWEAPPATLFGVGVADPRAASTARPTTLPAQTVDQDGSIMVPFVGRIHAADKLRGEVESEIERGLKGKANQAQVLVRITHNASANVTVVGEVTNSVRMPLTAGGERVLDALAAAGGVRQPVNKMTLQVTRGSSFQSLPLDAVIRDPRQNVPLQPGDVVTAMFQPLSFSVLGATGKNDEINFETQGISLAQALARAGGLADARSDQRGVFIFRFEPADALDWPSMPVATTAAGLVPVVYRLNLNEPRSLFAMQNFTMLDKDVLYVSNAPAAELQKFLNLVFSVVYPILTTVQVAK
jgi:polysaccharide export outer membrane protein